MTEPMVVRDLVMDTIRRIEMLEMRADRRGLATREVDGVHNLTRRPLGDARSRGKDRPIYRQFLHDGAPKGGQRSASGDDDEDGLCT